MLKLPNCSWLKTLAVPKKKSLCNNFWNWNFFFDLSTASEMIGHRLTHFLFCFAFNNLDGTQTKQKLAASINSAQYHICFRRALRPSLRLLSPRICPTSRLLSPRTTPNITDAFAARSVKHYGCLSRTLRQTSRLLSPKQASRGSNWTATTSSTWRRT